MILSTIMSPIKLDLKSRVFLFLGIIAFTSIIASLIFNSFDTLSDIPQPRKAIALPLTPTEIASNPFLFSNEAQQEHVSVKAFVAKDSQMTVSSFYKDTLQRKGWLLIDSGAVYYFRKGTKELAVLIGSITQDNEAHAIERLPFLAGHVQNGDTIIILAEGSEKNIRGFGQNL